MTNHYQRFCKNQFLFSALFKLFLLISTNSVAQENSDFTITPELSKQVIEKNQIREFKVYPVSYKEVEYHTSDTVAATKTNYMSAMKTIQEYRNYKKNYSFEYEICEKARVELEEIKKDIAEQMSNDKILKRFAYMIEESPIDVNSLSGEFSEFPETYMLALSNYNSNRLKNELITKLGYYDAEDERYQVVQKTGTKELYFIMSHNYLSLLQEEKRNQELLTIVHKLGYKEYEGDGNVYIKSKTSEIKLDSWTYQELKKNPLYISRLDNDQLKIAALAKQTILQSKILYKYASLYNIKRSRMSTVDINAWKTATANAQKLHNQIYKLNEKYDGNNSFTLLDKSDTLEFFVDNLLASKGVLGM